MAQQNKTDFKTTKNSQYADNTSQAITETTHRTVFENVADSAVFLDDEWAYSVKGPDPVVAASTANVTLATDVENGDTLDGITLATDDRILLKDQSTASENGVYQVQATGAPVRVTDFNTTDTVYLGATVYVQQGTANAKTFWTLTAPTGTIVIDTSNLTFENKFTIQLLDEDNMASDSATQGATQQSIKAYVDSNSGTPGGSNTEVQYNNSGAFEGASFTTDGTDLDMNNADIDGVAIISAQGDNGSLQLSGSAQGSNGGKIYLRGENHVNGGDVQLSPYGASGAIIMGGNVDMSGNNLTDNSGSIGFDNTLLPSTDDAYNLGSLGFAMNAVYSNEYSSATGDPVIINAPSGENVRIRLNGTDSFNITSSGATVGSGASNKLLANNIESSTTDSDINISGNGTGDINLNDDVSIQDGLVVGSPTGGNKGTGTINATAVYDDNTLLTDYVFEAEYKGEPIDEKHKNYKRKSLSEEVEYVKENLHLSTIIGRKEWEENGTASTGKLISQLWETVETQFLYIVELQEKINSIEERI